MKSAVPFVVKQSGNFNSASHFNKIQTISTVEHQEGRQGQETGGEGDVVTQLLGVGAGRVGTMATLLTNPVYNPQSQEGQVRDQLAVEGACVVVT
jgi:hypothetical protein